MEAWLKGITFDVWTASHRDKSGKTQAAVDGVLGHQTTGSNVMSYQFSLTAAHPVKAHD